MEMLRNKMFGVVSLGNFQRETQLYSHFEPLVKGSAKCGMDVGGKSFHQQNYQKVFQISSSFCTETLAL